MCPQIKLSKPVFQHVTANETVLAIPANETYPEHGSIGGMILTGENRRTRRKTSPVAIFSTTLPHGVPWERTTASAVKSTSGGSLGTSGRFCDQERQLRSGLTNLWHACPKWNARRFSWQAAFTVVPVYLLDKPLNPAKNIYTI
jgi:hypothetical protein